MNILCATDVLLVPFRPDEFSERLGPLRVLENIEDMGISETPTIFAHTKLVDYRRKQEGQDLEKILGDLKNNLMFLKL